MPMVSGCAITGGASSGVYFLCSILLSHLLMGVSDSPVFSCRVGVSCERGTGSGASRVWVIYALC